MRACAFLGGALLTYQRTVVALLNERLDIAIDPPVTTSLEDIPALVGSGTALFFLCGLPYTRYRDAGQPLQPLVAPVSAHTPDLPPSYRSVLLGRPGLEGQKIEDLDGLALGINGYDSLSGWVLPVGAGLPLERVASTRVTGAHRASLDLLVAGEIDCATIDSMLLASEVAGAPAFGKLPELATYGPAPSPPIVLVGGDSELAELLGDTLSRLHLDGAGAGTLALGGMVRLDRVADATYDVVRGFDARAAACTPS